MRAAAGSRRKRSPAKSAGAALGAAALVAVGAVGVIAAAQPASAAALTAGQLEMRGPGSSYAGTSINDRLVVSAVTTVKGTATFSIKVVNKASTAGQYDLVVAPDPSTATIGVKAGSAMVTGPALSSSGYFTNVIAAGGAQTLTLTVKTPATATQTSTFTGGVLLYSTGGPNADAPIALGQIYYEVNIKATTGPFADDVYTSTTGSAAVVAEPGFPTRTAAEAAATGKTSTFSVKLQNDSQTPGQLRVTSFSEDTPCLYSPELGWPATVKAGSVDVLPAISSQGGYATPVLAHGKSQVLTVVVTVPPVSGAGYCGNDTAHLVVTGPDGTTTETVLDVNRAVT